MMMQKVVQKRQEAMNQEELWGKMIMEKNQILEGIKMTVMGKVVLEKWKNHL